MDIPPALLDLAGAKQISSCLLVRSGSKAVDALVREARLSRKDA